MDEIRTTKPRSALTFHKLDYESTSTMNGKGSNLVVDEVILPVNQDNNSPTDEHSEIDAAISTTSSGYVARG